MPLVQGGPAPYGTPKAVIEVIQRYRDAGVPQPLTAESIQRVGISESLAPRTIQTLRTLEMIDEDGNLTEAMTALRKAATPDFKPALVDLLRAVYAEVFAIVEPATATYQQVHDAFRHFRPERQIGRMVALFLGLLEYAEYAESLPRARAGGPAPASPRSRVQPAIGNKVEKGKARPTSVVQPLLAPSAPVAGTYSTTVTLKNGGVLTLTASVNPMSLKGHDREFFYQLVDALDGYSPKELPPGSPTADTDPVPEEVSQT